MDFTVGDKVRVAVLIPSQIGGGVQWLCGVVTKVQKRELVVRIAAGLLVVNKVLVQKVDE